MKYAQDKIKETQTHSVSNSWDTKTSQTKSKTLQDNRPYTILQKKANNTGLPDNLKSGIENLSGHSMDDVKVHYNSDKPAQLNAHAYAQGTDIHIASGQEKHLPHEAWHIVQQKQGRVKPTMQMKGKVNVNDDKGLEMEADVMGARAMQIKENTSNYLRSNKLNNQTTVQGLFVEDGLTFSENANYAIPLNNDRILFTNTKAAPPSPEQYFEKIDEQKKEMAPPKEELAMENEGGKSIPPKIITFDVYQSNKKFNAPQHDEQPNDCGMYANALAFDKETWSKEKRAGEHLVGMTHPKDDSWQYNPADPGTKDNLSLDVGDMYRMDWDNPKVKPLEKSGHHVATVVAKDGEDHITSEADAGEKLPTAIFRMYGTVDKTFWQRHHEYFTAHNQGAPYVSKFQNPKNEK